MSPTRTSDERLGASSHAPRTDTHVIDSPVRPGLDAQMPDSMPRAEDDEATRAAEPGKTNTG